MENGIIKNWSIMPSHDKEKFLNLELMTIIRSGMMDGEGHFNNFYLVPLTKIYLGQYDSRIFFGYIKNKLPDIMAVISRRGEDEFWDSGILSITFHHHFL